MAKAVDTDGDGVNDRVDRCPDTPRGVSVNGDGCSAVQLAALAPPPRSTPPPTRAEEDLTSRGVIRLENVYFETNSSRLTPQSSGPLDEAGAALEKYPALELEVEGHTDARGTPGYNRRLGKARAEAVRGYLLSHFKLSPHQLTTRGYEASRSESRGSTPTELQEGRRVVLRVLNPKALPKLVEIRR